MTLEEIIKEVRAHALANYEKGGWDFVVECWEDSDIAKHAKGAKTAKPVIARIAKDIRAIDEQRQAVRNEIF